MESHFFENSGLNYSPKSIQELQEKQEQLLGDLQNLDFTNTKDLLFWIADISELMSVNKKGFNGMSFDKKSIIDTFNANGYNPNSTLKSLDNDSEEYKKVSIIIWFLKNLQYSDEESYKASNLTVVMFVDDWRMKFWKDTKNILEKE